MPIYAYRCKNSHEFEKLVKFAEVDKRFRCPECRSGSERAIAAFADKNSSVTRSQHQLNTRQKFTNW